MRLSSPFGTVETFRIALAGAVVAWLSFVAPIWDAYWNLRKVNGFRLQAAPLPSPPV
jgi:hypothetical protein